MTTASDRPSPVLKLVPTAPLRPPVQPPALLPRMVSLAVCVMALLALIYACLATTDVVVSAQGHVIPSGKSKVVQPLEPGIVKAIRVRDGQRVRAGEVLLELDPTATTADRDRAQRELWQREAEVMRLGATLEGKSRLAAPAEMPQAIVATQQMLLDSRVAEQRARLASIDADIARRRAEFEATAANLAQLRLSSPHVQRKHTMREELARTGHVAEAGLIETRLELINLDKEIAIQSHRLEESSAGLAAARQQRNLAQAEFRARTGSELAEASQRRDAARQDLVKAEQRRELQVLKAPIDGVVQQLAVTTVGGVVTAAQPLLTLVPHDAALEVEAQVLNRDIGHLQVGQRVISKIETFDFTRYGYIEGRVQWVGTDAVNDAKLGPVYPVRIQLDATETPYRVQGRGGQVSPGMSVTADIKTGERRLVSYFLAPLLRYQQESLRER